jgi:hypothetical protein
MSDALGVNLRNCELCTRLRIIVGGSYILFAVQKVHSRFRLLSYVILHYSFMLNLIRWITLKKSVTQFLMLLHHLQHKKLLLFYMSLYHCLLVESTLLSILFMS